MLAARPKPGSPAAFTLIELLMVVAIISLLLALLVPALGRSKILVRRATDGSNARQYLQASLAYATANKGVYPFTRREGGDDDMAWFRYEALKILRDKYGLVPQIASCNAYNYRFGDPYYSGGAVFGTGIGWIIWSGRTDYFTTPYVTPKRVGDQPTSTTFLTCLHYVSPASWQTLIPHCPPGDRVTYQNPYMTDPYAIDPKPEGQTIAYTDGSARWMLWPEMKAVKNCDWLFYDPQR